MSRKEDLEEHIRESYNLIRQYEAIIQTSPDPREQTRSQRAIDEQWGLIKGYLDEYVPLCEKLRACIPQDTLEIVARFPEYDSHVRTPRAPWMVNLPIDEPYYPLDSREQALGEVLDILLAPSERRTMAMIDGIGGIGKTALAIEIARRCREACRFEGILGESAKLEVLRGIDATPKTTMIRDAVLDYGTFLDSLAGQLRRFDIPQKPSVQAKELELRPLLQEAPYLIIVDNLETADNAQFVVDRLRTFLGQSRALLTSREKVDLPATTLAASLQGLEPDESLRFLREEARARHVAELLNAPDDALIRIHESTGGSPLAMKLVVGRISVLGLDETLTTTLRELATTEQPVEGLYMFIYAQSYRVLSAPARRLLRFVGSRPAAVSRTTLAHARAVPQGDVSALNSAIQELMRFSLINPVQVEDHAEMYYTVHQLTRHFVMGPLRDALEQHRRQRGNA